MEEVIRVELGSVALPNNLYVVSNRCVFSAADSQDPSQQILVGFHEPVFHVFNKRASEVTDCDHHREYFRRDDNLSRSNLLLVGDSLGDCVMNDGLHHEHVLKIGYLNDRPERLLDYLGAGNYDMVILGDPSFEIPLSIINSAVNQFLDPCFECLRN